MAYYLATRCTPSVATPGISYRSSMLYEPEHPLDLEWLRQNHDYVDRVSAADAHKWVKDGGNHSTALYVGVDGRIHRAVEERD